MKFNDSIPELPQNIDSIKPSIICAKTTIIGDLVSYGENNIAKSIFAKSENDYLAYYQRLAWLANWFIHNYPSQKKDGSSITYSLAYTLAAIYLNDKEYRLPKGSRRKLFYWKKIHDLDRDDLIRQYIDEIT